MVLHNLDFKLKNEEQINKYITGRQERNSWIDGFSTMWWKNGRYTGIN